MQQSVRRVKIHSHSGQPAPRERNRRSTCRLAPSAKCRCRTSGGAEIDLLLSFPGGHLWAVEIKSSLAPRLERGVHVACADLAPERRVVAYPGDEVFPVAEGVEAVPLRELARRLSEARR